MAGILAPIGNPTQQGESPMVTQPRSPRFRFASRAVASATLVTLGFGQDESKIDYQALAQDFLTAHGYENATPESASMDIVLDGPGFARIAIGAFDLRFPTDALAEAGWAKDFRDVVVTYVDLQENWLLWTRPELREDEALEEDWEIVRDWVESWAPPKLGKLEGGEAGTIFDELKAKDKVLAAVERLDEAMRYEKGVIESVGGVNRIVFAPTRKHFLEFVAYAGWENEAQREELWVDAQIGRSSAWTGWTQILGMEYASMPVDFGNPFQGATMNERDTTGLLQNMADRAAIVLLRKQFHRHGTHFFEQALGTNLVIAALGKNDVYDGEWKLEYRTSGSRTQPYSRFVPGGNPNGGTLPPRKAGPGVTTGSATEISDWRASKGENFFLKPLRAGQKAGYKRAFKDKQNPQRLDKTAHFELYSFANREFHAVTAPFLGEAAEGKELPPLDFLDSYEDFFRAYRSGFLNWLQSEGGEDFEEGSEAKFAELLQRQASRAIDTKFDKVIQDVYGIPLSHADGSVDSMEWRYLAWLAKKKR